MNNVSFIGMAGCGKSTIGNAVASRFNLSFIDTDLFIEKEFDMSLENIKKEFGYKFIREAEEQIILNLDQSSKIISTGGSAVYSINAMNYLKSFSKIIYINTPLEIIMKRINTGQGRGLAVPDGMSVSEVYSERKPLYENFAEYTLDGAKSIEELIIMAENIIYE
jgi:shikimate kinase